MGNWKSYIYRDVMKGLCLTSIILLVCYDNFLKLTTPNIAKLPPPGTSLITSGVIIFTNHEQLKHQKELQKLRVEMKEFRLHCTEAQHRTPWNKLMLTIKCPSMCGGNQSTLMVLLMESS